MADILGDGTNQSLPGTTGNDTIQGGGGTDGIQGLDGDDVLYGHGIDPSLGADDNAVDSLRGGNGNDTLYGDGGDDILQGDAGNNTIFGGAGNDTITVIGTDTVDGGIGNDLLRFNFAAATSGITVDLAALWAGGTGLINGAAITSVEGMTGTQVGSNLDDIITFGSGLLSSVTVNAGTGNDTITGGGGADSLYGMLGADTINGGAGNDTIYGDQGGAYSIGTGAADTIDGGDGNDFIAGEDGANIVTGGAGDDIVVIGKTGGTADGGAGTDSLQINLFSYEFTGQIIDLTNMWSGGNGQVGEGTVTGFERVSFLSASNAGDTITLGANYIHSGGALTIFANGGNDLVNGSNGAETIDGGGGDDRIRAGGGNDTVIGGTGRDLINGGAGDDIIYAATNGTTEAIANEMAGSIGNDTYYLANRGDTIIEAAGDGTDTVFANGVTVFVLPANVENLSYSGSSAFVGIGSNGTAHTITGGTGGDTLIGGDLGDTLIGGSGTANTLIGGAGNDTYTVSAIGDSIIELPNGGFDVVNTTAALVNLADNIEALTYTGTGNFVGRGGATFSAITGGIGADVLIAGSGGSTLDGGSGAANTLIGGTGDDSFIIRQSGNSIIETANGSWDEVDIFANLGTYVMPDNIDALYNSSGFALTASGNALDNVMSTGLDVQNNQLIFSGFGGNDTLIGGENNDILLGGDGNDFLDGGFSNNTLVGGVGADGFALTNSSMGLQTIPDFTPGEDKFQLGAGFNAPTFNIVQGSGALSAADGTAAFLYNQASGYLSYDADGNGAGAANTLAWIGTGLTLSQTDFVFAA